MPHRNPNVTAVDQAIHKDQNGAVIVRQTDGGRVPLAAQLRLNAPAGNFDGRPLRGHSTAVNDAGTIAMGTISVHIVVIIHCFTLLITGCQSDWCHRCTSSSHPSSQYAHSQSKSKSSSESFDVACAESGPPHSGQVATDASTCKMCPGARFIAYAFRSSVSPNAPHPDSISTGSQFFHFIPPTIPLATVALSPFHSAHPFAPARLH